MEWKPTEEEEEEEEEQGKPLLEAADGEKGGYRTLPYIVANEAFEKIATNGSTSSMTLYLKNDYHLGITSVSNIIFLWSSATNFLPLIGGITGDSYLGQFRTIGFGSIICLMGTICLWLTAVIPNAKPSPCNDSEETKCSSSKATFLQLLFLYAALGLLSVGASGIRSCSISFGAKQIEEKASVEAKRSYFAWYYGIYTLSILIGLTCIVYIQENLGWKIGFAVPIILMMIGVVSFHVASPFYVMSKGEKNLIAGLLQVAVASYRNRNLNIPENDDSVVYHSKIDSDIASPSSNLRFLNKACIVRNPDQELRQDGSASDPWRLCTVEQVEDLKSILRVIPIWSSGMIMAINVCQSTVPILQASSMDRHLITSTFEIPAASFSMFMTVSVMLWVFLYEGFVVPLASRLLKRPFRLNPTQRMGLGIFLSFSSVAVAATVENVRLRLATDNNKVISAMWLVPQFCLLGFAEGSCSIAQNEFYYSEFPAHMSSIATTMVWVGIAVAFLISSVFMNVVDAVSRTGGRESWISDDINEGHYDFYYLVLAGLSLANMVYFLACRKAYGPLKEDADDKNNAMSE